MFAYKSGYINDDDRKILDSLVSLIAEKKPVPEVASLPALFMFNPNEIEKSDFQNLGIKESVAQRIINYRESGGKFLIKSDLMKVYGFTESDFERLEEHIDLPSYIVKSKPEMQEKKKTAPPPHPIAAASKKIFFDINLADSIDLMSIKGIGPVLAARIIKFRGSLGGFTHKDQYFEVFGLPNQAAIALQESSFIKDDFTPEQIDLNFSNRSELIKHPYIDHATSRRIIDFRDKHGPFRNHDALKAALGKDDSIYYRLKPYVTF
jgi:competence protein ComEA